MVSRKERYSNFCACQDYIHRVGRTARAGRSGKAISFVTQYDVEIYQRIEHLLGRQLPLYPTDEGDVLSLQERVAEAQRLAKMVVLCNPISILNHCLFLFSQDLRELEEKGLGGSRRGKKRKPNGGQLDDSESFSGVRKRI